MALPALGPVSLIRRGVYILSVSLYLLAACLWLILTSRLPIHPVLGFLGAFFRARRRMAVSSIEPESGFCYIALVPDEIPSDAMGASGLELYEDGVRLPLGHAQHDAIRMLGYGRYSHWDRWIYFASSDNSDPRHNGRHYQLIEGRW